MTVAEGCGWRRISRGWMRTPIPEPACGAADRWALADDPGLFGNWLQLHHFLYAWLGVHGR
jgi:hypothetical protein